MSSAHPISNEKYVSFGSYRRNGEVKELPVWIVDVGGGKVGFTTAESSYKVKRVRNNPSVTLQPSDQRGNITAGTEKIEGTAEVVTGAEFERVKSLVKSKYGIQFTMISVVGSVAKLLGRGSGTSAAVIVTPA